MSDQSVAFLILLSTTGMVVDGHLTLGALASYCLYATNLSEARSLT